MVATVFANCSVISNHEKNHITMLQWPHNKVGETVATDYLVLTQIIILFPFALYVIHLKGILQD